ncbi:MAG: dTMP kinase [archaeon]
MSEKGKLIMFEGGEGCGKTTQISLFEEWLREKGYNPLTAREPGATSAGEAIRRILLSPETELHDPLAELLLFEAARADIYAGLIIPARNAGRIILQDRGRYASEAYQGYGRGMDLNYIRTLNEKVTFGMRPDLAILIDLDPEVGLKNAGADRFESEAIEFHQRVCKGYREIAELNSDIFFVLPYAHGDIDGMQDRIRYEAKQRLSL